tara:strand:+ start:221 stop:442 length:222 start_codon:yes stop_codon:yes gene_type:complete
MISEKKFNLELSNRENIIKQLRIDRNKMIINYQKLNSDFIKIHERIKDFAKQTKNTELEKELSLIEYDFKNYF